MPGKAHEEIERTRRIRQSAYDLTIDWDRVLSQFLPEHVTQDDDVLLIALACLIGSVHKRTLSKKQDREQFHTGDVAT